MNRNNQNANPDICDHTFNTLQYFYDDDWGHKGSAVFDAAGNLIGGLTYCTKCGIVKVVRNKE